MYNKEQTAAQLQEGKIKGGFQGNLHQTIGLY